MFGRDLGPHSRVLGFLGCRVLGLGFRVFLKLLFDAAPVLLSILSGSVTKVDPK